MGSKSYTITNERFVFTPGLKKFSYILLGVGSLTLLIGIILGLTGTGHWGAKVWSAILFNNMFFLGIALAGLFFVAAHYLAYGGWYVVLKRVPEAISSFIPYTGILMLFVVIGAWMHWHHIYHWADDAAVAEDPILQGKAAYLNLPFFTLRYVIYFVIWTVFAILLRNLSINEDKIGGLSNYNRSKVYAAIFIVLFAITSSTMSWDFLMSINAHWYSTLYGWYVFSSLFVAGIAVIILMVIYLKMNGYLQLVTNEHLHDLGKFLFAFSVFWTYLWFSQYMLIWYSNIGEETEYFRHRIDHYPVMFWGILVINFVVPFLALMSRNSKRKISSLILISLVVLFGHWLDFFLMVTPGATANTVHLGIFEIGLLLGYTGFFILVVFNSLSKTGLVPVNHPFFKESIQHHT